MILSSPPPLPVCPITPAFPCTSCHHHSLFTFCKASETKDALLAERLDICAPPLWKARPVSLLAFQSPALTFLNASQTL